LCTSFNLVFNRSYAYRDKKFVVFVRLTGMPLHLITINKLPRNCAFRIRKNGPGN
jgi:hypothetical protein